LAQYLVGVFAHAQAAGQVCGDAQPSELGVIFLTGLFALLATGLGPSRTRAALLDRYVTTIVQGMEAP
jgi:hypothetical protein